MKIRTLGVELFYAVRRTDMTKLIVAFRNLVNAPKNCLWYTLYLHVFVFSSFQIFELIPHCHET